MELLVIYKLKENSTDAFIKEIYEAGLPQTIRGESGCMGYDYFVPTDKEASVVLIEKWENKEAQTFQLGQPHMKRLREIKDKYAVDTIIILISNECVDKKSAQNPYM